MLDDRLGRHRSLPSIASLFTHAGSCQRLFSGLALPAFHFNAAQFLGIKREKVLTRSAKKSQGANRTGRGCSGQASVVDVMCLALCAKVQGRPQVGSWRPAATLISHSLKIPRSRPPHSARSFPPLLRHTMRARTHRVHPSPRLPLSHPLLAFLPLPFERIPDRGQLTCPRLAGPVDRFKMSCVQPLYSGSPRPAAACPAFPLLPPRTSLECEGYYNCSSCRTAGLQRARKRRARSPPLYGMSRRKKAMSNARSSRTRVNESMKRKGEKIIHLLGQSCLRSPALLKAINLAATFPAGRRNKQTHYRCSRRSICCGR